MALSLRTTTAATSPPATAFPPSSSARPPRRRPRSATVKGLYRLSRVELLAPATLQVAGVDEESSRAMSAAAAEHIAEPPGRSSGTRGSPRLKLTASPWGPEDDRGLLRESALNLRLDCKPQKAATVPHPRALHRRQGPPHSSSQGLPTPQMPAGRCVRRNRTTTSQRTGSSA